MELRALSLKAGATNGKRAGNSSLENGNSKKVDSRPTWGRAWTTDFRTVMGCLFVLLVCPVMPLFFYHACTSNHCDVFATADVIAKHFPPKAADFYEIIPAVPTNAIYLYFAWLAFQAVLATLPDVLHFVLPSYVGGIRKGAITPAGGVKEYNINGLQAWAVTHVLWALNQFHFRVFPPTLIFDHFGAFLVIANICGYSLALFAFVKGRFFPTDAKDCKLSGNVLYDFLMGVEFNPRLGALFDFKLFFNGRPGIVCWTLINLSFASRQIQTVGHVTDAMLLLNALQAAYVIDFFWNEAWYLKTIDICHDHFGFYLAWGDLVWLPFTYTLQGFYLAHHPVHLGPAKFTVILLMGVIGYYIFRSANRQKDRFRANKDCLIWGKKPTFVTCEFQSADGLRHKSTLLTSGWWGVARHMNYTGDLLGSLAYCLCCGSGHLLPYFYTIYMPILLIHRIYRDEHRCSCKYGKYWGRYTDAVPYRLVPGLY